jgi:hypothetical protein
MPLGNEELREEGRTGTPGLAGAPGIIEATVVAESPGAPTAPHVPLWGPPSRGGTLALWEQPPPGDGDATDASTDAAPPASKAVEPVPLRRPLYEPRHRRAPVVGVALAGAVLLLGLVAVTGWPGTEGTDSVANQFGPGDPGPTGQNGRPVDLPPSQPATPVVFAPSGDVVRPEPRRARIVDPRSGRDVIVDLPPGTTVNTATGQVVVRVTGTPTSITPTSTTRPATTTSTVESTTSTTEDTTTTTEDTSTTTTTEDTTTTTSETVPDPTIPVQTGP